MLTGRPIGGPDGHGVRVNTDSGRGTVDSYAGREIDSVFDVVHAAGGSTAMYATKAKFALFQRSWADSLDRVVIDEDNPRLVGRLVDDLRGQPPRFTFVHLSAPDVAGHDRGFMGSAYLAAVRRGRRPPRPGPGGDGRVTACSGAAATSCSPRTTADVAAAAHADPARARRLPDPASSWTVPASPGPTSTPSTPTTATPAPAARRTTDPSRCATPTSPTSAPPC